MTMAGNIKRLLGRSSYAASFFLAAALMTLSCAPPPPEVGRPEVVPEKPPEAELSSQEQNALAMVEYERILDMTVEKGKRNVLPEMEESYRNVIARYPDAYLAQESYWWLILMNLEDYYPPRIERAEKYYEEFLKKYPDSSVKLLLDDTLARFYYRSNIWDRLLKICSSYVRKYTETGELRTPMFMFFYSEAKFRLNDLKEAKKGYKIVVRRFPDSTEASLSRQRLEEIEGSKGE